MQRYNKAPLPFQGQKRRWLSEMRQLASTLPQGATVVDLFGGSGLCSHTIKQARPDLTVIWNDYDDYQSRLDHIGTTNKQINDLRCMTDGVPCHGVIEKGSSLHRDIFDYLDRQDYIDWQTIGSMVTFSACAEKRASPDKNLFNRIPKNPYSAEGYLDGVTRVQADYRDILSRATMDDVIIVDPPYLTTSSERYYARGNGVYWGMSDHLRLLNAIKGRKFLYFSSEKSEILELDDVIKELLGVSFLGDFVFMENRVATLGGRTTGYKDLLITNLPLEA